MSANVANIVTLVELLRTEPSLAWEEVEGLVAGFPGWQQGVALLRDHTRSFDDLYRPQAPNMNALFVSDPVRERLLEMFRPYALLLDTRQTPAQRVVLLEEEAGVDVAAFCEECLQSDSPEIAAAAQEVQAANEAETTLLRTSSENEEGLLRAASAQGEHVESLLHPSEPSEAAPQPEETGWLRRLFKRHAP